MKSIIIKVLVIALLVVCFGGGIWQMIDYIEDRIITSTINLIENSEFVSEIRVMVRDIARDTINDLLIQGYSIASEGGVMSFSP